MAFIAPALGTISTVLGAGATLLSGYTALQQGNYQAAVAKNNAEIAANNARLAANQAQRDQLRSDREYAAQVGSLEAMAGASGALGASRVAVENHVRRNQREAALDIRRQGEIEVRGFNSQADNFLGKASSARAQGLSSMIGSVFQAGSIVTDGIKPKARKRNYPWRN